MHLTRLFTLPQEHVDHRKVRSPGVHTYLDYREGRGIINKPARPTINFRGILTNCCFLTRKSSFCMLRGEMNNIRLLLGSIAAAAVEMYRNSRGSASR